METLQPLAVLATRGEYFLVFGLAALACLLALPKARDIADPDTRHGLMALLITSAGWSLAQIAYLATSEPAIAVALHTVGLIVGLSTVGGWLYFCSAYTGRSLHRDRTLQWALALAFLAVIVLKVSNPVHGLYYTTTVVSDPFAYVEIRNSYLHWTIMGGGYALASIGYFMLYERFRQISHDTRPLLILVAITGLPIGLDIAGLISPALLNLNYEPLGVAVFAVGLLYVYFGRLRAVQLAGAGDNPVVILDDADRIQEYNREAAGLFPALSDRDVIGTALTSIAPEVFDRIESGRDIINMDWEGETRYYQVSEHQFTAERSATGRALVFTDVTHREQYRTELERQNDRLDSFASMLSHDLRNPLNVAQGRLELAREEHDNEHLQTVDRSLDRIESLIDDVLQLARQGQPVETTERVNLGAIARDAWKMVETADAELAVAEDADLSADPDRLQRLFENLFRNAVEHGGESVTVTVGSLEDGGGFFVADDGRGIPPDEREQVFESGYSTAEDGTGFGLAIVEQIVTAHEWAIELAETETGTRFEIRT